MKKGPESYLGKDKLKSVGSKKDVKERDNLADNPYNDDEDETRSVKAEIDYKLKDAARHIVANQNSKRQLREKVLKNIDSVVKPGKHLSEKSLQSLQSRISNISKRTSAQPIVPALAAIEEDAQGEKEQPACEVCRAKFDDKQDMELNQRINA